MITLIHGGHRHGTHWEVLQLLKKELEALGKDVHVIDLTNLQFYECCGDQVCQIGDCLYKNDALYKEFEASLLPADVIYIITPTYFNMPPAKLKSFIDRTNALLPVLEGREKAVHFGTWVSGEADLESISCNSRLLSDYASIMGWIPCEDITHCALISDDYELDAAFIKKIAHAISEK